MSVMPGRYSVARRGSRLLALVGAAAISLLSPSLSFAQSIKLDNSFGRTPTTLTGPNYAIPHTLGEINGSNLLHSFSEFHLHTLGTIVESATFTGPDTIGTVITRITGDNPSTINGSIASSFGTAKPSFYFINPRGIMFGPNASVTNVSASVHLSTAEFLRLTDGAQVLATLGADSTLTSAPIASFGFLSSTPASIMTQPGGTGGQLRVPIGGTLSLIGGDVVLTGAQLIAPSGTIQIAGAQTPGEIPVQVSAWQPPALSPLSRLELLSGASLNVTAGTTGSRVSGTVIIRTGQFVMDQATISGGTATPAVITPTPVVGTIDILTTGDMIMKTNSSITSTTIGVYAGPAISLTVAGLLQMDGASTAIGTNTFLRNGTGGILTMNANRLTMSGGAKIRANTAGAGTGGNIAVTARDGITISGTAQPSTGPSGIELLSAGLRNPVTGVKPGPHGNVTISVTNGALILTDGAQIRGDTLNAATTGNIMVSAQDSVTLSGMLSPTVRSSLFLSSASSDAAASVGNIAIDTGILTVERGARIQSGSGNNGQGGTTTITARDAIRILDGGEVLSLAFRKNGGDLSLSAPAIEVIGGQVLASTTGTGNGGNIILSGTNGVLIADQGQVSAKSTGDGNAGNVQVNASTLMINGSPALLGKLSTYSERDLGGALHVNTDSLLVSRGILATETNTGTSGPLQISAGQVLVNSGGRIETSAAGSGKAGTLTLTATESLELMGHGASGPSRISSVAGDGEAGQVIIAAPSVQVAGGLIGSIPGKITPPDLLDQMAPTLDTFRPAPDSAIRVRDGILNAYRTDPENFPKVSAALESLDSIRLALGAVTGLLPNQQTATQVVARVLSSAEVPLLNTAVANTRQTLQRAVALETIALVAREANLPGTSGGLADKVMSQVTDQPATKAATRNVLNLILIDAGASPENVAGGSLQITAGTLAVTNGGELTTRTQGAGRGGTIRVDADQSVTVAESSRVTSQSTGSGDAGRVIVTAPVLAFDTSEVTTAATGTGLAGDIVLRGSAVSVSNTRIDSSTSGQTGGGTLTIIGSDRVAIRGQQGLLSTSSTGDGPGGSIDLRGGQIELTNGAAVTATSVGSGNAGDIRLTAEQAIVLQDSTITTRATAASGGDITLMAPTLIQLGNSRIESSVAGGSATKGGNILIDPQSVIIRNSQILANAFQGTGGNITIVGNVVLVDPSSTLSASSSQGVSGQVAIQAPVNNVATALSRLSQQTLNATELLTARCSARLREGTTSSLTVAGRDGVPAEPGGNRPTAFVTAALRPATVPPVVARASAATRPPLVLLSPHPEFYALRDAAPLPLGCGS